MSVAIVTFSKEGATLARALKSFHSSWKLYFHENINTGDTELFDKIMNLMPDLFSQYKGIVIVGPCGIAVRAIAPCINHKTSDPAVVVVDAGGRFAVSLLSGHEGGANDLAIEVANCIGAEPCISTTTEALKTITAGIGCRKGVCTEIIIEAIKNACNEASVNVETIRSIATAQIKSKEQGIINACKSLNIPLRVIPDWQMHRHGTEITQSEFVESITGLPGVAEPAALVSGRNTTLLLKKYAYQGVTVALAKERCMWSE
jgi:cobalt-precorrin 5A hydrolase